MGVGFTQPVIILMVSFRDTSSFWYGSFGSILEWHTLRCCKQLQGLLGGLRRWKKWLVKDARLLLPLTEVMGDRQAYISASRCTSSVIAKAKTEAWQTTCSSLSPRSNPKSVHSLLRSIADSSSSSSSSPNFPNCSSLRESASVYAAYLRSHFSISKPKALRSRARGHLTKLCQAMGLEESHSSFCSPFSFAEFLAAASNLSSSTATGPDKAAYPMLKHFLSSGMDFLLHIFNLS